MPLAIFLTFLILIGSTSLGAAPDVDFNRDVRPLLSRHCIACHGPDEADRQAGLRLDTLDDSAAQTIVPGDADASDLIARVTTSDPDLRMPPVGHADPLSAAEVDTLRRWIDAGATFERHWSFVPPVSPPIPVIEITAESSPVAIRINNTIDPFILDRLRRNGLQQNPLADPKSLMRRLSLDLTGLPPSAHPTAVVDAIDLYLTQPTHQAYAAVVDLLLTSPGYAEHWAAMWLDIARYADTTGYSGDEHRDIWPWRDWLIRSLQSNMSYRDLSIEMIAGDLLPAATQDQILATAMHRNTLSNNEGGTSNEEFRVIAVKDRLSTTLNAWMGLTVRCAECHSHKYDPISHQEYYALLDHFNQTADNDLPDESPTIDWNEATLNKPLRVPVLRELDTASRRETFVMLRGNHLSPGERVAASVPAALTWGQSYPPDRLGLTHWIFDPQNPLTSRVAVNRYWSRLMGIGLVETEEDFGSQGTLPSHPELLDHLAIGFRDSGWDIHWLLRTIVTSATYQQSQVASDAAVQLDPRNRLLSRGPRVRLAAEVVRDQALAVAGLLSDKRFGPPVYPPSPIKKIVNAFTGGMTWNESTGEDRYRRAIYTYVKRSSPHPLLETFDVASREVCNLRRVRTNTPLQSFMTLNDVTFIEAARALAQAMIDSTGNVDLGHPITNTQHQLVSGWRSALATEPTAADIDALLSLHQSNLNHYRRHPQSAAELLGRSGQHDDDKPSASPQSDDQIASLAAMTVVANVMMNLDAFLTN